MTEPDIAAESETRWYRAFWLKYLIVALVGFFVGNVASILTAWWIWAWWVNVR